MITTDHTLSQALFARAKRVIPGGVNSPVRAFKAVGGNPLFVARAKGAYLWDVDNHRYIDYVGSWGPMILGHGHPRVVAALEAQLQNGTSYGAPTELEVKLAEAIQLAMPSMELVRMVNSGTEATMSALRLARAYTKREVVIKFEGGYHGHGDSYLSEAGSGLATLGIPGTPGVPEALAALTVTVPFNDLDAMRQVLSQQPVAAVIVEPVAGNMGVVLPEPGFLEGLRQLTREFGALLIFDEVITGFRVAYGGAQTRYGITPDLTCLGKIIGGGLPVGAFGGRREIMEMIAPVGPVYQAGTLSGNPLAMAAGLATLSVLSEPGQYEELESKSQWLADHLMQVFRQAGVPLTINRAGSLMGLFFHGGPVRDYHSAKQADSEAFVRFFWRMLDQGVYLAPSAFEATFVSLAHSEADLERTIEAARWALSQ